MYCFSYTSKLKKKKQNNKPNIPSRVSQIICKECCFGRGTLRLSEQTKCLSNFQLSRRWTMNFFFLHAFTLSQKQTPSHCHEGKIFGASKKRFCIRQKKTGLHINVKTKMRCIFAFQNMVKKISWYLIIHSCRQF